MRRAEQSERKSLTRSASLRPPVHSVLPSFVRLMCACVDRAAEILSSFCPFRGDWRGSKLEMERIRARAQPGRGIWNWGAERMKKDRVEPTNERMIEREGRRHVTRAPQQVLTHHSPTPPKRLGMLKGGDYFAAYVYSRTYSFAHAFRLDSLVGIANKNLQLTIINDIPAHWIESFGQSQILEPLAWGVTINRTVLLPHFTFWQHLSSFPRRDATTIS